MTAVGPTPTDAVARRACPPAWTSPRLWRDAARLVPWTLLVTSMALGAAWAVRSQLDVAVERSLLAVICTLGLCVALDDEAAELSSATPTVRWARRLPRAAVPVVVLLSGWTALVVGVAATRTSPAESSPWWAWALEWATLAASQLAVAAVAAGRSATGGSIAPGLLLGLVWLAAAGAPALHRHLQPVEQHTHVWSVLMIAAAAVFVGASVEPLRHHGRAGRT